MNATKIVTMLSICTIGVTLTGCATSRTNLLTSGVAQVNIDPDESHIRRIGVYEVNGTTVVEGLLRGPAKPSRVDVKVLAADGSTIASKCAKVFLIRRDYKSAQHHARFRTTINTSIKKGTTVELVHYYGTECR